MGREPKAHAPWGYVLRLGVGPLRRDATARLGITAERPHPDPVHLLTPFPGFEPVSHLFG